MTQFKVSILLAITLLSFGCQSPQEAPESKSEVGHPTIKSTETVIVEKGFEWIIQDDEMISDFELLISVTGRYRVECFGADDSNYAIWIEDYIDNKDDRTYNVTGSISLDEQGLGTRDGSPLAATTHKMRIHATGVGRLDSIRLSLLQKHSDTEKKLTQNMDGTEWSLVWSDEFDEGVAPDSTKWSYNVGNWGWGNNEPQYYTDHRSENARLEDGNLIIQAHRNDMDQPWTSARLTTQSNVSFKYGKVEFRAKVPVGRGTWAAGWLLGDSYQDELSWPYCGEIDVLECVGYEIDDETGAGINHATCHTRAYYFKQGNQIGSKIELDSMDSKFHTFAVEWHPDAIYGLMDGERYYTYDKNADELEWPFDSYQNIILNLAVGGGWGGAKGIDENLENPMFILDYVRVYELK
jgi:beta-glucanase (GH16 family)